MLLTETIKNSTSAIKKRRAAIESKQHAETYAKALVLLAQTSERIQDTLNCAEIMKSKGIISVPMIDENTRNELLECISDCGNGVSEMRLTLETVKLLQGKGDAVAKQMKLVWQDAAQKYSDGSKGYLSMIGGLSNDPKRARDLAEKITRTVEGPPSVQAVNKLVSDVTEAKQIAEQFSLNPEIEGFLKAVSSQRATVLDLTPNVMAWLKEKDLLTKLKIRF